MDSLDYKPNSHRSKIDQKSGSKERPQLEKIVKGPVKTKKKGPGAAILDTLKSVGRYLYDDVVVPSVKKLFVDFVKNGAETIAWGSDGRERGRSVVDRVSYDSFSKAPRQIRPSDSSRSRFDFDSIVIDSRGEAEMVLNRLDEVIATYGHARVSDLYDLLGISCDYTYNDYGWTNLSTARVVPVRGGGFGFELPRVLPLHR